MVDKSIFGPNHKIQCTWYSIWKQEQIEMGTENESNLTECEPMNVL